MRRALLAAALLAGLALVVPSHASASFHLMKIRQVSFGSSSTCSVDCAYVQLQMYQSGQSFVSGHELIVYKADGTSTPFKLNSNVPNGQSQRRILIADSGIVDRDLLAPGLSSAIDRSGGAVCFDASKIDCVAWGTMTGGPPAAAGNPAPAPPPETLLERSIARGCPTLLEAGDDTGNSASDLITASVPTAPLNNADTPPETPCSGGQAPDTTITDGPKKKTSKRKASFRFTSAAPGATFECKLDEKLYEPCTSPQVYKRIKRGKHTFQVRAVANGKADPSPATYKWKRVRK